MWIILIRCKHVLPERAFLRALAKRCGADYLMTESSCKIHAKGCDSDRHLIAVNRPHDALIFLHAMGTPPALIHFLENLDWTPSEVIVACDSRRRVRKLYATHESGVFIHACETLTSSKLSTCVYHEVPRIDLINLVGERAARVFRRWDGRRGHIRFDENGKLKAVHLVAWPGERVGDTLVESAAQKWIGKKLHDVYNFKQWMTACKSDALSYISFECFGNPTVTIYHSTHVEKLS